MKKNLLFLCLAFFASCAIQAQVTKIEPLHWWVGMKNPLVQLMVYGEKFDQYQPEINYPGVRIEKYQVGQNPKYAFLYLRLDANTSPGTLQINWKASGKPSFQTPYVLEKREKNSANRKGFGPEDMIYLITPDRFANGDPKNDQLDNYPDGRQRQKLDGRHGGDLLGLQNHLNYIQELGTTAIWLNPVLENNQPEGSYHGYAITDFYQVDPRFGTNDQYRTWVKQANDKGMKVIIDGILNHIGHKHPWMNDLPFEDWINAPKNPVMTSHRRETIQDPYAVPSDVALHTDGWFVPSMPDLNQRNPHLATYLIQQSIWWVEYANLHGIRMDTYPYSDRDFLAKWSKAVMDEYPFFTMVGEEWTDNPAIVSFWQRNKQNANGYRSYMPSMMDFPLQTGLIKSLLQQKNPWDPAWLPVYAALTNDFLYPDPDHLVIFADNHDMSRIFTQVKEDFTAWKQALVYLATMRGIPQIYYGTEFLGANPKSDQHGEIRLDMPGGWLGDTKNVFTSQGLTQAEKEALIFFRQVFQYRQKNPDMTTGKLKHLAPREGWYAFVREGDRKTWLTILYQGTQEKKISWAQLSDLTGTRKLGDIRVQENATVSTEQIIFKKNGVVWVALED